MCEIEESLDNWLIFFLYLFIGTSNNYELYSTINCKQYINIIII